MTVTPSPTAQLVDAIAGNSSHIPAHCNIAYYLTGTGIAWTAAEIQRFKAARVPILQQWTPDTAIWLQAGVLDVERYALTLPQAHIIATYRASKGLRTTIYISASGLPATRRALAGIAGITYWVANWNLTEPEAAALILGDIVAIQFASPNGGNNNPTLPNKKTIRQADVDMSVASIHWLRDFAPLPSKPSKHKVKVKVKQPHPKTAGGTLGATVIVAVAAFARTKGLHITGAEQTLLAALGAFITATVTPTRRP